MHRKLVKHLIFPLHESAVNEPTEKREVYEAFFHQYDFISYLDVEESTIDLSKRFKVIILPKTICLSDTIEIKDALGLFHHASVLIKKYTGNVQTFYLNLSPVEYWDPSKRFSEYGHEWRKIVSQILQSAGLRPRVKVYERGNTANMIECLLKFFVIDSGPGKEICMK